MSVSRAPLSKQSGGRESTVKGRGMDGKQRLSFWTFRVFGFSYRDSPASEEDEQIETTTMEKASEK